MVIRRIEDQAPKNFAAYVRKIPDVDLKAMLDEIRGELLPHQASGKPPWCGHCDETTRQIEQPDGRVSRCPDCHQLTATRPGVREAEDQEGRP